MNFNNCLWWSLLRVLFANKILLYCEFWGIWKVKGHLRWLNFLVPLLNLNFSQTNRKWHFRKLWPYYLPNTKNFKRKWPSLSPLSNHCKVWKCLMNCNADLWNTYSVSVFPETADLQTSLFRFVHKNDIWPSVFRPSGGNKCKALHQVVIPLGRKTRICHNYW